MAIINEQGVSEVIKQAHAASENILDAQSFGAEFRSCLSNSGYRESRYGLGEGPRGVVMCYGDCEGLPAIIRAYRNLPTSVSIEEFGREIAHALQKSLEHYPTGEHNLVYAHFRLHGLALNSIDQISAKIIDNSRIIKESLDSRDAIYSRFNSHKPAVLDGFYLTLENGLGDDFEGLSLQLKKIVKDEPSSYDRVFSKVGFYLDTTNSTAYISNCQGRRVSHFRGPPQPAALKVERERGREYGRFKSLAGMDPRTYVVTKLFELLSACGVEKVKAIRPEEHLMNIGDHKGFKANYDGALESAGMHIEDAVYRTKKL